MISLAERDAEAYRALRFLERRGYRRCDIPACNCGSWHGGQAEDRLSEIREALDEAGAPSEGGLFVKRIEALAAERDAARTAGIEEAADLCESEAEAGCSEDGRVCVSLARQIRIQLLGAPESPRG